MIHFTRRDPESGTTSNDCDFSRFWMSVESGREWSCKEKFSRSSLTNEELALESPPRILS